MNEKIITASNDKNPIIETVGGGYAESIRQFNPKKHDITMLKYRPNRLFFKQTGKDDEKGNPIIVKEMEAISKVPFAFQNYIITQKAQFAIGSGINLVPNLEDNETFRYIAKNWKKNKTEFYLQEIHVRKMSETRVASIFFAEETDDIDKFRIKFKIVSPEKGDTISVGFDPETDDMISFTREYEINDVARKDVYTMKGENAVLTREIDGKKQEPIQLPYRKLPIVYWSQERGECDITSELIREYEFAMNEFITQQGYSADPILFGTGDTLSMPNRGEAGKYIEGEKGSDLKFVTPDNATESRKMQFEIMQKFIFGLNRSVFLDMETMKELGDVSGSALDRYLMDAFMEAKGKQMGAWGIGVQRMINFMVDVWTDLTGESTLEVDAEFTRVNFEDTEYRVDLAMKASGGLPVIDHLDSINYAGISKHAETTIKNIDAQRIKESEAPQEGTPDPITKE